ncbi:MAG: hypothetical protein FWF97_00480 [Alphaproteobacteria bacterium]|nr:hypothetical protein [Alphaproteobacteria bacterium]
MKDDEKIFGWGVGLLAAMFVIGASLQVCYRAQSRAIARANAGIVRTQQETAEAQARLAGLVRPEVLRSVVAEMYPRFESIGFKKNINAMEIPLVASN